MILSVLIVVRETAATFPVFIHRRREITLLVGSDTFLYVPLSDHNTYSTEYPACPAKTGNDFCPVYLPVTVVETAIDTADITQPFLFPMFTGLHFLV